MVLKTSFRQGGAGGRPVRIAAALDGAVGVSAALQIDGERVWAGRLLPVQRRSEGRMMPALGDVLRRFDLSPADVEAWTVGTGPGSFTGLRAVIALVLGICRGSGAICRGLPSSFALARQGAGKRQAESVAVLHDARRGEVIVSWYRRNAEGLPELQRRPWVAAPEELAAFALEWDRIVTPHGERVLPLLPDAIRERVVTVDGVDAGEFLAPPLPEWPQTAQEVAASLEPVYVRPAVFVEPIRLRPGFGVEEEAR